MRDKPTVLVVHREGEAARALIAFLRDHELEVRWERDGEAAFQALDQGRIEALVTERGRGIDGIAVLRRALARHPDRCAVVVLDEPDDADVLQAMRDGATDVQVSPIHLEKLLAVLRRGFAHQRALATVHELKEMLDERYGLEQVTGGSAAFTRVVEAVRHLAATRATVLIEGETGSGKSLVARALHRRSPRKDERFVWVSLGGLAEAVIESELFGVETSAATDQVGPPRGRVEAAEGGTLFLDQIDEAPAAVQVRLMRVLRDREIERVGGQEPIKVDVRVLAATQRDLQAEVDAGRFRRDLFHRLSVVVIRVPPLRERRDDIPRLAERFVRELNREHGRKVTGLTHGALERLIQHPWPGNVRELRNTIESMIVFAEGKRPLDLSDLPPALREAVREGEPLRLSVGMTIEEAERQLLEATLRQTGFDKPRAASLLGIALRTLYRKIQKYGLA